VSGNGASPLFFFFIVIGIPLLGPVHQSQAYHHFADQRTFLGIPRCLDVVSNIGFLIVGLWGLLFVLHAGNKESLSFLPRNERWPYVFFFLGVALTAFGSAYYHLAPDNARLIWDRLPMTVGFMALLAAVLGERVDFRLANRTLAPLMTTGVGSVLYWRWTESLGRDDLRLYGLVQFGSLVIVLLTCALLPSRYTRGGDMFVVVVLYAVAKAFEALDKQIFALGGIVSGHSLKHITAAVACFWVLRMLMKRKPASEMAAGRAALL
jgi:hypothetical protein